MHDTQRQHLLIIGVTLLVGVGGWMAYRTWTRPAAVEFDNLKYVQMLTTAVSNRNAEWVTKVEAAVQRRFEEKQMSARERAEFQKIIDLTRATQWDQADRACFRLAEAQLGRRRTLPASDGHSHSHTHSDSGPSQLH